MANRASEEAEFVNKILATRSQHINAGSLKMEIMSELEEAMSELKRKYHENITMTKKEKI